MRSMGADFHWRKKTGELHFKQNSLTCPLKYIHEIRGLHPRIQYRQACLASSQYKNATNHLSLVQSTLIKIYEFYKFIIPYLKRQSYEILRVNSITLLDMSRPEEKKWLWVKKFRGSSYLCIETNLAYAVDAKISLINDVHWRSFANHCFTSNICLIWKIHRRAIIVFLFFIYFEHHTFGQCLQHRFNDITGSRIFFYRDKLYAKTSPTCFDNQRQN
jgi:hypothetical protein